MKFQLQSQHSDTFCCILQWNCQIVVRSLDCETFACLDICVCTSGFALSLLVLNLLYWEGLFVCLLSFLRIRHLCSDRRISYIGNFSYLPPWKTAILLLVFGCFVLFGWGLGWKTSATNSKQDILVILWHILNKIKDCNHDGCLCVLCGLFVEVAGHKWLWMMWRGESFQLSSGTIQC